MGRVPTRIERALGLGGGELGPLLRLAAVHAALGGGIAAGDATVQSVFLARAGVEVLPAVLLVRALLLPLLALAYASLSRGRSARAVLATLAALAAAAALGERALMPLGWAGAAAAYVAHEIVAGLLTVHWGVYLLASVDGERALRGVSLVYAGARLGGALAGAVLVALVGAGGAPAGMYVVATCFALVAPLALRFGRRRGGSLELPAEALDDDVGRPSMPGPRRSGLALFRASPLLGALVASTVAMVLVRYVLRYQQQAMLDPLGEEELARLLGTYAVGANMAGAVLSLVVMTRLLPRLGLTRANGLYAIVTGAAQLLLLFVPGVPAALFARFADDELKHTLKTPVSSLFYEAFSPPDRPGARAVVLGLASPVSQAAGAVLLAGVVAGGALGAIGAAGVGLCLVFGFATAAQNRRYRGSLAARKGG